MSLLIAILFKDDVEILFSQTLPKIKPKTYGSVVAFCESKWCGLVWFVRNGHDVKSLTNLH